MSIPPNTSYCKIIGKFQVLVGDSGDVDDLPDFAPVAGSGLITPKVSETAIVEDGYSSHVYMEPISVLLDEDGDLSQGGNKYVMLVVPESPVFRDNFSYYLTLYLTAPDTAMKPVTYGPVLLPITAGGVIDLADL